VRDGAFDSRTSSCLVKAVRSVNLDRCDIDFFRRTEHVRASLAVPRWRTLGTCRNNGSVVATNKGNACRADSRASGSSRWFPPIENDLRNRIVASCEVIRNTPGIFATSPYVSWGNRSDPVVSRPNHKFTSDRASFSSSLPHCMRESRIKRGVSIRYA
ncbi:hypothetical protein ALC56_00139, partial [Trachymyrmex septentrionalis]